MMDQLPGLGPDDQVPTAERAIDLAAANLTPEDYFMFSRIDGHTSLRQLVLISGFPAPRAVAILCKLRDSGAIRLPLVAKPQPGTVPPAGQRVAAAAAGSGAANHVPLRRGTPLPFRPTTPPSGVVVSKVLAEDVELSSEQKQTILAKHASLRDATLWEILEVEEDADRRALKVAYRNLSKRYHPDRFFGKRLGSFKQLLREIFEHASNALQVLSDPSKQETYRASLATPMGSGRIVASPSGSNGAGLSSGNQARQRASELYEEACHHHLRRELDLALPRFASALALDPHPRYFRRAAEAAFDAQELRLAEEYAKKATELDPHHASGHRIVAKVWSAQGRRSEAREALERARRLDPSNPHIVAELRALGEQD